MGIALGTSVVYLPDTGVPYPTLLVFLAERFPKIPQETWIERITAGKVLTEEGQPITLETTYLPDKRLFYYREVVEEPVIPFQEEILFHNEHLLVACKPPFLPVTPTGPYVRETLINRLKERTGNPFLSPINRIDRETSGLVLVSANKTSRGAYQKLFMDGQVRKTYLAIAYFPEDLGRSHWLVENRIEEGEPWFRMRTCDGTVNARSLIRLVQATKGQALFELDPLTGKKHQLRLHLSGLGCPIIHDRCYPILLEKKPDDFSRPLQLLSKKIEFQDPINGKEMVFEAMRTLSLPVG
ncbi:MAG: pseudouridine synthase [Proteobacteria bacterium]|nr:pseudouridine synthase [Pseudomonadota bacterium]